MGTNIAAYAPVVGERLKFLLLGGHVIGPMTLLRFYVLHCVILPLADGWCSSRCTSGACARTA